MTSVHTATFTVDPVAPPSAPLNEMASGRAVRMLLDRRGADLETCSPADGALVPCHFHGFVNTVLSAYSGHRPLVISPDHVWLMIAQGFVQHVHVDVERWRGRFGFPPGRRTLTVRDDSLGRNAPPESWEGVCQSFIELLRREQPDLVQLLTGRFSTTGPREGMAYAITAMHAFDPYFQVRVTTLCGIPAISLEGTHQDWIDLRERAEGLAPFDLDSWLKVLLPALDRFVAASAGDVDVDWWRGFFKEPGYSGGPSITGHIRVFFPYFRSPTNPRELVPCDRVRGALTTDMLPSGLSRVSFTWQYLRSELSMELVAGFVGTRPWPDQVGLRPEIGWAVREVLPIMEHSGSISALDHVNR